MIVLVLFLIAFRLSQLSCELIQVEPKHLRTSQINSFNKDKPIRSEDKTILMKFAAYLEYDKLKSNSDNDDDDDDDEDKDKEHNSNNKNDDKKKQIFADHQTTIPGNVWSTVGSNGNNQQQNELGLVTMNSTSSNNTNSTRFNGPTPSNPSLLPTFNSSANNDLGRQPAKKRFLPLDLESIETRRLNDAPNKYKYILSFNCTKMNMVLVRSHDRVYVESMKLELKVSNKHKTECDVQLPAQGAFLVGLNSASSINQTADNSEQSSKGANNGNKDKELVHYYCNKPLKYACYYNGSNNNNLIRSISTNQQQTGIQLVTLHINAIEFETSVSLGAVNGNSDTIKVKHVNKNEFSTKKSKYTIEQFEQFEK